MRRPHPDRPSAVRRGLRRMLAGPAGYADVAPERLLIALAKAPLVDEATLTAAPRPRRNELTARELEVLRAMAVGLTDAEIAATYGIAVDTVKTYARQIYSLLAAKNRAHATAIGLRNGLIH